MAKSVWERKGRYYKCVGMVCNGRQKYFLLQECKKWLGLYILRFDAKKFREKPDSFYKRYTCVRGD